MAPLLYHLLEKIWKQLPRDYQFMVAYTVRIPKTYTVRIPKSEIFLNMLLLVARKKKNSLIMLLSK